MYHQQVHPQPSVFDEVAASYDEQFNHTRLARLLRPRVWRRLAQCFSPGQTVLELACGTGEDALWLARRGVKIVATDASTEMLRIVNRKSEAANLNSRVETRHLTLQQLVDPREPWSPGSLFEGEFDSRLFDGAFSNFGGLNTIGQWRPLAERLGQIIAGKGRLVLVVMGPCCPWELIWFLAHGHPWRAFRRFKSPAIAEIGGKQFPVWYPSARRLRRAFLPWFHCLFVESLGLWLPSGSTAHLMDRWPGLFRRLERVELRTARWTGGWGDHYIMVLERKQ